MLPLHTLGLVFLSESRKYNLYVLAAQQLPKNDDNSPSLKSRFLPNILLVLAGDVFFGDGFLGSQSC